MSDYLSTHLTVAEFISTQHRSLLAEQERAWVGDERLHRNAERLARDVFEPVREVLAVPLYVTSGFRCRTLNEAIGGQALSYHLDGLAVDVVPLGLDPRAALFAILAAMRRGELPHLDKAIVEMGRWIHLQAARDGQPARMLAMESSDGRTFAAIS